MASTAALSQSMHHITATKLTALSTQRDAFEVEKKSILGTITSEQSQSQRVRLLLDWFIERKDKATFERTLDIQSRKYQYASLFGKLVTEWLENPNDAIAGLQGTNSMDSDTSSQDYFEQVGRAEMQEQRAEWESIVFDPSRDSNPLAIKEYLSNLFASTSKAKKLLKTPLETLRENMTDKLRLGRFAQDVVKRSIKGLLSMDLLSREKRNALVEFQNNHSILVELADVLNMKLDELDSWSWGDGAIPLEVRRHLNRKYRYFMDEEILQALFLHFIGTRWAVHLKARFSEFFHSGAWKQSSFRSLDKKARQRRQGFLGSVHGQKIPKPEPSSWPATTTVLSTIRNERRSRYQKDFFLTQLPSTVQETSRDYGSQDSDEENDVKSPIAIKQAMLHLVTTESLVNTRLYGSFTILQSDFKWFGPSIPHSTIHAVLEFFGVPDKWLKLFKKFLETPVKFVQDGPDAQTHIRRCGVPVQHVLSDALGEAVLFCLDFSVNQATGTNLYRFHDDLWFWGQEEIAVTAWKAIEQFTEVMGLCINKCKTGSIRISGKSGPPVLAEELPKGSIRWGFLRLNTSGTWVTDDKELDDHIDELQRQLSACKSVLAWVQAWNMYVSKFFATNLGKPANCLGRQHIDMVIDAFTRIQQKLFSTTDGSVIDDLKRKIAERFQITSLSEGFFYFPIELGGLDLQNPLIPLLLVRDNAFKEPMERIEKAFEREEELYLRARKAYNDGEPENTTSRLAYAPSEDEPFMSLDEYTRYVEETSDALYHAYTDLLSAPDVSKVELTAEVEKALDGLPYNHESKCAIHAIWREVTPYYQWVAQLYAGDVIKRFGSLSMGEKKLLPIGLASMLRSDKIRWQA